MPLVVIVVPGDELTPLIRFRLIVKLVELIRIKPLKVNLSATAVPPTWLSIIIQFWSVAATPLINAAF